MPLLGSLNGLLQFTSCSRSISRFAAPPTCTGAEYGDPQSVLDPYTVGAVVGNIVGLEVGLAVGKLVGSALRSREQ
jgi:hypothetical protein